MTDNGTQYTSLEFQQFCKNNNIKQSFTAPHHPATNGAAENFVETFKDKVDKIVKSGKSLDYAINLFLFDYRSTEHCTTGRTPAYMTYKRELRTRFDVVRSNKRTEGTIVKRLSPVTFEIRTDSGKIWKRHVDQIIRSGKEQR